VIHADDLEVEAAEVDVEYLRECELRAGNLVAEPDGLHRRLARHCPAQCGHRVGDVEHPRVGTDLLHIARDGNEHRNVAQRPHDATRTHGVADRLLDPVALGDLEVMAHALERARRDAHDDVVGAFQRVAPIGGRLDRDADAREPGDVADEAGDVG
jgi:hypothetical protein